MAEGSGGAAGEYSGRWLDDGRAPGASAAPAQTTEGCLEGMAGDGGLMSPGTAAREVGIAVSTLRVYSVKLADMLSIEAGRPAAGEDGRPGVRRYRQSDVQLLKRAKELLGRGLTYAQVAQELRGRPAGAAAEGGPPRRARGVAGADIGILLEPLKAAIEQATGAAEAWRQLAAEREREVGELRARVYDLEAALTVAKRPRSWWRRLVGGE